MTQTLDRSAVPDSTPSALSVIDTDVHEMIGNPLEFLQYVEEPWRGRIHPDNWMGISIPYSWPTTGGLARPDARPSNGLRAGSDYQLMRKQHLDAFNIKHAVLTGLLYPSEFKVQPDFAVGLSQAYNRWVVNEWLAKDPRFLGSICVAAQRPDDAVAEIEKWASHPQMVQVLLPVISHDTMGRDYYHRIYEAAVRNKLVVGFHQGANVETAVGLPTYFLEWHTAISQAWQCQLISLVVHGVFEKFPDLRVVMIESSWTWLPHLMWRFDHNYRSLRREVPWVKRLPSEYIRDQVRFTTQPMEFAENPDHLYQMFEMVGNDEFLMFSSDYPHWDFDAPDRSLPSSFPPDIRRKVLHDNAAKFYQLGEAR
ncbi:amidohydrolase family protein [Plantactinospora solaniradicis]|uniref:Amidohydrolase family protein n=1 Tax=Plantactinospora solaniradicis TaxID=1723736 RepID=A0ABW1K2K9_9ACTN